MSDPESRLRAEQNDHVTADPRGKELWHELADNLVEPSAQPPGLTLQGPGEPGTEPAGAEVPGVLGGPPVVVTREDS
jgi:hypothetical protein